ncbi:MAG: hypothetical protein WCD81_07925 [Candidatus Bathyarchaeia archaeon]
MIIEQVEEAIKLCKEAGREPIALVINPKVLDKIYEELRRSTQPNFPRAYIMKLFDLTIVEHVKARDFFIVDNRSWAEQKF